MPARRKRSRRAPTSHRDFSFGDPRNLHCLDCAAANWLGLDLMEWHRQQLAAKRKQNDEQATRGGAPANTPAPISDKRPDGPPQPAEPVYGRTGLRPLF